MEPSGRNVVGCIQRLAREHGIAAIEKLVKLMEGAESERAQAAAAVAILDRGCGKPTRREFLRSARLCARLPMRCDDQGETVGQVLPGRLYSLSVGLCRRANRNNAFAALGLAAGRN